MKNQKGNNNSNYRHGGKHTKLYAVWVQMNQRIFNPNNCNYENYGGRGITICPEWTESYIIFRDWALNNEYKEGLQINRINNNSNYEPSNCNFVTRTENMRSTRHCKIKSVEIANDIRELYATGKYTQIDLAIKYGISQSQISYIILNKGWL